MGGCSSRAAATSAVAQPQTQPHLQPQPEAAKPVVASTQEDAKPRPAPAPERAASGTQEAATLERKVSDKLLTKQLQSTKRIVTATSGDADDHNESLDKATGDALIPSRAASMNPKVMSRPWIIGETADVRTVYEFGAVLGKGQFGTTRLATPWKGGEPLACKSISKRKLANKEDIEDVQREVQVLHHLSGHPNVVQIKAVYEDRHYVHILMEVAAGGELFERIVERGHYSERDAANLFRTMVAVVAHCHQMGVMHRDLKPENFLLSDKSADAVLKATDFGLSVFFKEGQTFKEIVGSAYYVAPEVLKRCYSKEADIWSLGVLLYILLSGVPPFYGESESDIFQEVLTGKLDLDTAPWPSVTPVAKDLIRKLLVREPHQRLTAQQILDNPWVRPGGVASSQPIQSEVVKRLQGFAAMNRLKKEALKIMVGFLPENEIRGLQTMFKAIDADGSGFITVDELKSALKEKGHLIPEADIQKLLAAGDVNGDGKLDYEEFLAATIHQSKLQQEEHLYRAFQVLDVDGSGFIERDELMNVLGEDGSQEMDSVLAQVDRNSDGQIDYEEFCAMMRETAEWSGASIGGNLHSTTGSLALLGGHGARTLKNRVRDRTDISVEGDLIKAAKPARLQPL